MKVNHACLLLVFALTINLGWSAWSQDVKASSPDQAALRLNPADQLASKNLDRLLKAKADLKRSN